MRLVSNPHEFLRAPIGCQLVTKYFAYWYPRREFSGFALWGSPERSDVELLNRVMDVVLPPNGGPHLSLVDMGRLGTVDPTAFRTMAEYLASRWHAFGELIVRQALIRPSGFAGAVVAGFYEVITPNFPVELFAELDPALHWLGLACDAPLRAAVLAAREDADRIDPSLRQLRLLLRQDQARRAELHAMAKRVGVSARTLQRKLAAAGTTFAAEVQTARLETAQSLMLAGGISLTRIALELGFSSLQSFSALFRKRFGQSPSAWLQRRLGSAA
jgi:AraC-like DNA-binding protein